MSNPARPRSWLSPTEDLRRGRTLKRKADDCRNTLEQATYRCSDDQTRRHTPPTMTGRSGSTGGQSASSPLVNRPILDPTPPSTLVARSRSRSQSPVRKHIRAMETGLPPVRLCIPRDSSTAPAPQVVDDLEDALVHESACAIPASLRQEFEAYNPRVARQTPPSVFSDQFLYHGSDRAIWTAVKDIEQRAAKCFRKHMDEAAWCDVVRRVLELALTASGSTADSAIFHLELHNVTSQAIDSSFAPRIHTHAGRIDTVYKKTDFVLAVDLDKTAGVGADPEQILLSPMTDAYTGTLPLLCGLEVKRLDGSEEEAQLQLMVWQTAMLAHLDYTRRKAAAAELPLPPVIGWTVTNHSWKLYIAWKQQDTGAVTVIRPFAQPTAASMAGTENVVSIFVLLKILVKLIVWFENHYYPAYQALVRHAVEAQAQAQAREATDTVW